jgi:putative two-component system response regulator
MQKTIFVVDDNLTNLSVAKDVLKDSYKILTLPSAEKMFAMMEKVTPDFILLDIEMPEMDGFEALSRLKENPAQADIPVIFLTSMTDSEVEARGFQLGVIDFIIKPFSEPVLLNRIKTHLNIDELIRERTEQLHQKTEQLEKLQNGIVFVLADMVESRDVTTGGHIERTTEYIQILIDAMVERGIDAGELAEMDIEQLVSSARLHDVGKIAISDLILNKPGKLTDEEYDTMKTHTSEGEKVIDQIAARTGEDQVFLYNARLFAGHHHERWDGKGYPHGLAGEEIPLQGRIMAIADVYDALISVRPYKRAFTHEEATNIIVEGAGTQFDPTLANLFYEINERFNEVGIS